MKGHRGFADTGHLAEYLMIGAMHTENRAFGSKTIVMKLMI